jgi:tripartite-type tricarboxylate transporter receptor subunit TctC
VINPALYDKIPYDARKSFDPVTLAVSTTVVLAVHPAVPAQTVNDLIGFIKTNPSKYNYATAPNCSRSRVRATMTRSTASARPWRTRFRITAGTRKALPDLRGLVGIMNS